VVITARALKQIVLFGLMIFLCSACSAQPPVSKVYVSEGHTIHYSVITYNPPIAVQPEAAHLNQDSALNCVIFFNARLAKQDVQGAALLTTNPAQTEKAYTEHRARVGEAKFGELTSGLFKDKAHFVYELVIGKEHALLRDTTPDGAQLTTETDGKYFVDRPEFGKESAEVKDLFVLVNAHAQGKLKF